MGENLYPDVPTYPQLVREFFENLRIRTSSNESKVKGILIVLDKRRIGSLLEMPRVGSYIPRLKNKEEELKELGNLSTNKLSVEMRLLYNIVSRIFFFKRPF